MITPEQLAERLTPPVGTGPRYAAALYMAEGARELAERILDATARGPGQDAAIDQLVVVMRSCYAGVDPVCSLPPTEIPVQNRPADGAAADPTAVLDRAALMLDVAIWRLGLRTSGLHPFTRLVGLVLADACGPSGFIPDSAQPTLLDLRDQTGLHLQPLHVHLQDLVQRGWASRTPVPARTAPATGCGPLSHFQLRLPSSPNTR